MMKTIKQLIDESGIAPHDLADRLDIAKRTIYYWMSGEREPSASEVIALADAMGQDARTILAAIVATHQAPKQSKRRGRPKLS